MEGLVEILKQIQGNDNALRKEAEKRFVEAKTNQPGQTVEYLFGVLEAAQVEQPVREQAAVLLRQCLSKAKDVDSIWSKLGAAQPQVQAKLLQLLEAEPVAQVRRQTADIVQSLGNQIIDIEDNQRPANCEAWPELMPMLIRVVCDTSKDSGVRADCVCVVKELVLSVWQVLIASGDQTVQVLKLCLTDAGSEAVRANAATLLCEIVENTITKSDRARFATLVPDLCTVVAALAQGGDKKLLDTALQALQMTPESADFFKDYVGSHMMPMCVAIGKSYSDGDTRKLAVEVIVSMAESKPKTMLKVQGFLQQAFDVFITLLGNMDEDHEAWAEELEEADDSEDQHQCGKEALDRVCRAMHRVEQFAPCLEVLKPFIAASFQSGDWKQTTSGIVALSQISEYIDEEALVTQMLGAIRPQLKAPHIRVRWAAWGAVAQFAEDHDKVITTDTWTAELLPDFIAGIDDPCVRVCLRSMEAFQHYGESVEREDLEPHVQTLMEKLGAKLQSGGIPVQKATITYIAVIAGQIEDGFAPYYAPLMPVLKQIIESTLHKVEERTLLGKCFECISLLATAAGRSGFRADSEVIMEAMIKATQVPNLPSNDPVKEYMLSASERICSVMKEDFAPFLPHLLPGILEKFTLAPKEFTGDLDEGAEVSLTMLEQPDGQMKVLVMSSSEVEDLIHALECVHAFVEKLGKAYVPYVQQTAEALLPVFDFSVREEVRNLAFDVWGQLVETARAEGQAQALTQKFMQITLPKFGATTVDVDAFKTCADGVSACLKKAGPNVLTAEELMNVSQVILKALKESFDRRDKESIEKSKKVVEAGDDDDVNEEEEDEGALRIALCEVLGALMQHHADSFIAAALPLVLELVAKLFSSAVAPTNPQLPKNVLTAIALEDRKLALFIVCDFLEHLKTRITGHWGSFMPQMVEDIMHQNPELRQPACYGMSLAAKDPAFAPLSVDVSQKLAQIVTQARGLEKKKTHKPAQGVADNALTALVEILLNHSATLGAAQPQLWSVWMGGLPCQEDGEEGEKNHATLLQLIQQEKPEVVGEGGANLPKLVQILVDVYKTEMVTEETSAGIGKLVVLLGQARLEQYAGGYSAKQQKKLARIMKEAAA